MKPEEERRDAERELVLARGVECHATLPDGNVLDGVIYDCSVGGVRINAAIQHVSVGMEIDILFVFPTQEKVQYRATVIHINEQLGYYGVQFNSDPIPIEVHRPTD